VDIGRIFVMNKNEYYIFSKNLKAQIAIDEEKANNGDVDAMIRLARYFRTGETISSDDFEGVQVGLWYEYENDEGEKLVDMLMKSLRKMLLVLTSVCRKLQRLSLI